VCRRPEDFRRLVAGGGNSSIVTVVVGNTGLIEVLEISKMIGFD
jgi:hypothetical protein